MGSIQPQQLAMPANADLDYDVLIIGAGLSGIYSLIRMRQMGLRARVIEAGSGEGGTWFWNRYPGARFDSESYSYIFSFSDELLNEWDWTEHFSPQPETLKYAQFIVNKFDLKRDMQFNTKVKAAHFQTSNNSWLSTDEHGKTYSSRWLVSCMGILNEPTLPAIPGVHDFQGQGFHTARWPENGMDAIAGKRVGIIGTGATAIQTIQEIKKVVGSLTVFQRTANWTAPLRNTKISKKEMAEIRGHKWLSNFHDISTNREANRLFSEFISKKMRERVDDPVVAEKLIPKNHGFGTRRVPLEGGYYEAFNQPNVELVDLTENPIERVTAEGIRTKDKDFEFDVIIYATGFDAVTGSFRAVDIKGVNGVDLQDVWGTGIRTFLGLTVQHFPNMFMIMGPHQMFGNIPRSIEYAVDWVSNFIGFAKEKGLTYAEATEEGMDEWTAHVHQCAKGLLANEVDSWMTGVNKNLAHKQVRTISRYNGPAPGYRKCCDEVKAK
ncbi:hypothetical protein VE03_10490, partial [Pseudogymnoascus sp. 23342-1-I1]